jgi:hypothetical protein
MAYEADYWECQGWLVEMTSVGAIKGTVRAAIWGKNLATLLQGGKIWTGFAIVSV